ncbi:MAG: conjugal transfer protein TraX, partial [Clostridiales Family XIII bacterium]|nr:conjugal transfer protein TraX [Clostridiales Family XIII bacterium]
MSGFTAEKPGLTGPADIKCLTGGGLKFMGVILMVFDHLHQMFFMFGVPDWFTWIGRLVAPLFLFMCAEGFHYTRSRKRYMLLLFAGFEFMNLASHALRTALPNEEVMLINNIFGTMFLSAFYMWMVDMLRTGIREKKPAKLALAVGLTLLSLLIGFGGLALLSAPAFFASPYAGRLFLLINMIPNVFLTEGGWALVLLAVLFYICREKRLLQVLALVAIGLLTLTGGGVQWMMIFAAIPILLYNGARGKGNKYFFYIFYP